MMKKEQLENFLQALGYGKISSNLPEITIFFIPEASFVNAVLLIDDRRGLELTCDSHEHVKETVGKLFHEKGIGDIHLLSLVLSADGQKGKELGAEDPFCWLIDTSQDKLLVFENQADDFYGLRGRLEEWLSDPGQFAREKEEVRRPVSAGRLSWVNAGLVAVNVAVFLICTFTGDLLYRKGAFSGYYLLEQGQYYRMFTSMFLHAGVDHLVSNMLILYYLGEVVEKRMGHILYTVLYFISGIGGNLLSMTYELNMRSFSESVGASGAIFGVVGALLFFVLLHRGHLESFTTGRVLFLIGYSLYSGFTSSNVNNAAHIGGLAAGFITAFLMESCRRLRAGRKGER